MRKVSYILRQASVKDLKDIMKLAARAHNEGPEKTLLIDKEKMYNLGHMLISSKHQFSVVAVSNGHIKGVMLGHVDSHSYCSGLVASDICLYIAKSLRGTKCAEELIYNYVQWTNNIKNLVGSTLSASRINATTPYLENLYQKYGYTKAGFDYIRLSQ